MTTLTSHGIEGATEIITTALLTAIEAYVHPDV